MFSRQTVMIAAIIALIVVNFIVLSISNKQRGSSFGLGRMALAVVAPFQKATASANRFARDVWTHYFYLVSVAHQNDQLARDLNRSVQRNNYYIETELTNQRLRNLVHFKDTIAEEVLAAQVVGKDPSPWYKTIIIDKGRNEGISKGMPVVVSEGIVGQVVETSGHYAKVLLITDPNNAVDALIQRNRARGIIKAEPAGQCVFKYALRKYDIQPGDILVSSGLDRVYPKGLRIGTVASVKDASSGIFQPVTVTPFVDFERLEEVLILLNPASKEFAQEP